MKKDITELFIFVDDFCKALEAHISQYGLSNEQNKVRNPTRISKMTNSEILTILLLYQQSPCKNFKYFYMSYLQLYKSEFPNLLSYQRFVAIQAKALPYLIFLLNWLIQQSQQTGIAYIDSTPITVCHNKRIRRNKVFASVGKIGKSTKGWFFGLKLHLVINEKGQIHGVKLTAGNVDDRSPVPALTKHLTGLLLGDKGYIKQELFTKLYGRGLKLITSIKKNMKNTLMDLFEKILLRKRSIIETVFDYLKNKMEIEHSRHRSVWNCCVHIISTLIAYSLKKSKPSIKLKSLIQN